MNQKTVSPENFTCPVCGENLGEDEFKNLMRKPFNNYYIGCYCGAEITCSVKINMFW